jgi:pyridoxamine 5'-phosphate oxidase family protein
MVSGQELQYLTSQCLARIATVSTQLQPDVAPIGFEFDGQYFYIDSLQQDRQRKKER